jgi:hypothetical protein
MLPGIRFLFAAVALSVSILIFGLGAAALLRAAHEEFSSNSSWRAAPEPPMLAQQPDTRPVLAMLRFDPPPGAREVRADARNNVTQQVSAATSAPAEPEAVVESPPNSQKVAALSVQENSTPAETPKVDATKVEAVAAPTASPDDTTTASVTATNPPAAGTEARVATTEEAKPAASDALPAAKTDATRSDTAEPTTVEAEPAKQGPATSEAAKTEPTSASDSSARKVAALGGSPVAVEEASAKRDAGEKAERKARARAEARAEAQAEARAKARKRLAAQRARLARLRQAAQQPTLGLFGEQRTPAPAVQN